MIFVIAVRCSWFNSSANVYSLAGLSVLLLFDSYCGFLINIGNRLWLFMNFNALCCICDVVGFVEKFMMKVIPSSFKLNNFSYSFSTKMYRWDWSYFWISPETINSIVAVLSASKGATVIRFTDSLSETSKGVGFFYNILFWKCDVNVVEVGCLQYWTAEFYGDQPPLRSGSMSWTLFHSSLRSTALVSSDLRIRQICSSKPC